MLAAVFVVAASLAPVAAPVPSDLLVVLADTGRVRDGLPVYVPHSRPQPYLDALTHGFSGRLLRVYRDVQRRVSPAAIEPAYLLLSDHEGGFPREGFWLGDVRHAAAGYVDLQQRSALTGRFGAIDQIFPHELMHVMVRQLAGPAPPGPSTQVHAIGVTTDRVTAFQEGFAEHAQVMALDDEDADSRTRALPGSDEWIHTQARLAAFRRALEARWAPAPRARIGFLFWYNAVEQAERYYGVRSNAFRPEPPLSPRMLSDPHGAYAWTSIAPGDPSGRRRRLEELLAREGVIAAFFLRLVTSSFASTRARPEVYRAFGVDPPASPSENAYLKIFYAIARHRTQEAMTTIRALIEEHPADAAVVTHVAAEIGIDVLRAPAPEIWVSNRAFVTGTSMYDQYAALPRIHAFDLNAASTIDVLTLPGVDRTMAGVILGALPVRTIDDLVRVPGVAPRVVEGLRTMASDARVDRERVEEGVAIDLSKILWSYARRALAWIVAAAMAGAWLMSRVRTLSHARLIMNGLAAAAVALLAMWVVEPSWIGAVAPALLFGIPSALWELIKRGRGASIRVFASWAIATIPAIAIATPI